MPTNTPVSPSFGLGSVTTPSLVPKVATSGLTKTLGMRGPLSSGMATGLGRPVNSLRCQAVPDNQNEEENPAPSASSDLKKNLARGINVVRAANEPHPIAMKGDLIKPFNLTPSGHLGRQVIKRGMYAQLALWHSAYILAGKSKPLIEFRVENSPPSLFINYRIKPERLAEFKETFGIPDDVNLLPMQCVEGGASGHLLSINVYAVSGITTGLRAEESVYIDRGDGKASYLVLGATTDNYSMDPVDVVTVAGDLQYNKQGDDIEISYSKSEEEAYRFKCQYDQDAKDPQAAVPLMPWVAANDFIYWPNGVCDRAHYNGDLVNEPVHMIDGKGVTVTNSLPWSEFVDPEPVEVFALTKPLDFIISPWHNIE
jgi:hypothetical protein